MGKQRTLQLIAISAAVLAAGLDAGAQQSANSNAMAKPEGAPSLAQALEVEVVNKTVKTLCAENDNVHVDFKSSRIQEFELQARHPAYIASVRKERTNFDLVSCSFRNDPVFAATPRKKTFWEKNEFWLVGYTFPGFWRPNDVRFRVGDTIEKGFHLVQLWMLHRERAEEILVVYPPDGYWRARPLPYEDLRWTAYGSSFLAGPVEVQTRPLVRLKEISFDPETRRFTMHYLRGGSGTLRLKSIDQKQITLSVAFSPDMPRQYPFAALRSMYVSESNSDVARLSWRKLNGVPGGESLVDDFKSTVASEVWARRKIPSRHNLSAPDLVFRNFLGKMR